MDRSGQECSEGLTCIHNEPGAYGYRWHCRHCGAATASALTAEPRFGRQAARINFFPCHFPVNGATFRWPTWLQLRWAQEW